MLHPLITEDQSDLRRRVINFIKNSYNVKKGSNIIFVCGGNSATDMRMKFKEYSSDKLTQYDIFFPEYAMKNYFTGEVAEPFDISEFEELIGNLSEAIVIFPEAPGSFAEVGYFSVVEDLAKKIILILNSSYQGKDSFISQGPAKKISVKSIYEPILQIDYSDPDFSAIEDRIRRFNPIKYNKSFQLAEFSKISTYEMFCLIHEIVRLMKFATLDDVVFIFRGIFNSHISEPKIKKIMSILVGSDYLKQIGTFGHFTVSKKAKNLLDVRVGKRNEYDTLNIEIANILEDGDTEFSRLVEEQEYAS